MSATAAPAEAARSCCSADPLQHRQPARATSAPRRSTSPGTCESAGFECELLGATPERPNLVARLPRRRRRHDGPTLCYLGHVDTVLANPAGVEPRPVVG